jgi:hypothetical protein
MRATCPARLIPVDLITLPFLYQPILIETSEIRARDS